MVLALFISTERSLDGYTDDLSTCDLWCSCASH